MPSQSQPLPELRLLFFQAGRCATSDKRHSTGEAGAPLNRQKGFSGQFLACVKAPPARKEPVCLHLENRTIWAVGSNLSILPQIGSTGKKQPKENHNKAGEEDI